MDSQLTLVTLPLTVSLAFSRNSMKNATLFLEAVPVYTISTDPQSTVTEISGAESGEVLVRISRKTLLPDTIAFPTSRDNKEVRLTKWIQKQRLPDGSPIHLIETAQGKCLIKTHPVHRLALFRESDLEVPVAHWQSPSANSAPILVIDVRTWRSEACPQVVAAFVVQEFNIRMAEQASQITLAGG
ncbi:hypothetical protein C8R43DRAFT_1238153 [Mycena crocata]|nr:hypothetical protein C8R43DRAFT_1238153 [Mycena crocata]